MNLEAEKLELIELLLNSRTESVLKQLRSILEQEQQVFLTDEQYEIINHRREAYIKGESKSYSWEQVKNKVKSARNEI